MTRGLKQPPVSWSFGGWARCEDAANGMPKRLACLDGEPCARVSAPDASIRNRPELIRAVDRGLDNARTVLGSRRGWADLPFPANSPRIGSGVSVAGAAMGRCWCSTPSSARDGLLRIPWARTVALVPVAPNVPFIGAIRVSSGQICVLGVHAFREPGYVELRQRRWCMPGRSSVTGSGNSVVWLSSAGFGACAAVVRRGARSSPPAMGGPPCSR